MELNLGFVLFAALMAYLLLVRPILGLMRDRRAHLTSEAEAAKAEALFRSAFPELQPRYHPRNVADYVVARVEKGLAPVKGVIGDPPGFADAVRARVSTVAKGERTVLEDAAGAKLAEFVLEKKDGALGAVRVGAGKFTVRRKPGRAATVKYWHPDREFEWSPPNQWKFVTRLADEPVLASDSGTTWTSSSSGSATSAPFVGGGGTFDGGGASGGWDAPAGGEAGSAANAGGAGGDSSGSETATSTSY